MIFGAGAPTARHTIVASLPSKTVTFFGDCSMTGVDAFVENEIQLIINFWRNNKYDLDSVLIRAIFNIIPLTTMDVVKKI